MPPNDPGVTVGGVTYRVTPQELQAAATNTDTTAAEIDAILGQIRNYVMSVEWTGAAHNTFTALMADYDRYAQMLRTSLTNIGAGLRGNYANYTEAELAAISNLQNVNADLPSGNQNIDPMNLS